MMLKTSTGLGLLFELLAPAGAVDGPAAVPSTRSPGSAAGAGRGRLRSSAGTSASSAPPAGWRAGLLSLLGLTALRRRDQAARADFKRKPAKHCGLVAPKVWRLRWTAALAAAVSVTSAPSHAITPSGQTSSWMRGSGNWNDLSNWSGQQPPLAGDSVRVGVSLANILFANSVYNQLDDLNLQGYQVYFRQQGDAVLTSNSVTVDTTSSTQSFSHYTQDSGLNLTSQLSVGVSAQGNGDSLYWLRGGSLITGRTDVGTASFPPSASASVSFRQSGGLYTAGTLRIGLNGAYTLEAGRVNLSNFESASDPALAFFWVTGIVHVTRTFDIGDSSKPFNHGLVVTVGAGRILGADTLRVPYGRTLAHGGGSVLVDPTDTFINNGTQSIDSDTFTVNGSATSTGLTTMAGGTMDGFNGSYGNQGTFTGYGRIQGDVNVVNDGVWVINGGRLQLASTRPMFNTGTMSFASLSDTLDVLPYFVDNQGQAGLVNNGLLQLSGQQITGDGLIINDTGGTLSGWGTVRTSFENQGSVVVAANMLTFTRSLSNQDLGVVELTSPQSRLAGAGVVNEGTVQGLGTVSAPIYNLRGGTVEARGGTLVLLSYMSSNQGLLSAAAGAKLQLSGGMGRNEGQIVLAGGTMAVRGNLDNAGSIGGFGTLQVDSLSNAGRLQFTGGTTLLVANFGLSNASGGQIIASGNANVSFFGAVHLASGSELRVSEGAVASFFDAVQADPGALFTGTGAKHYEGGFASASAVVAIHDPGSVALGPGNVYVAELAGGTGAAAMTGSAPSLGFDQLLVDGTLTLGGQLKLVELPGWQPQPGDRLKLFGAGTLVGYFDAIDTSAAPLGAGLVWDFSQLAVNGEIGISAVPESGTWALWMVGLGALALHRRRARSQAHNG